MWHKNKYQVILFFLLSFIGNSLYSKQIQWQKLAYQDLKAAHNYLLDDSAGGVDKNNLHFTNWLDLGYQQARLLTKQVNSASSYNLVMNYYLNGFADQHVEYMPFLKRFDFERFWPGFTVYYQNRRFYVSGLAYDKNLSSLPPKGAQLISCDGRKPATLMKTQVFPYFGNPNLQASWFINAPRLFFYYPNSWLKRLHYCKVLYHGKVNRYTLNWQPISQVHAFQLRQLASYPYQGNLKITPFTKNGVWLSLSTFMPETKRQEEKLHNIISAAKNWRSKKIIIIDVRGNTGGNSFWGTKLLKSLYGEKYFQQQMRTLSMPIYQWRVSAGNIDELSGFYLHYAKQNFAKNSVMILWLENTIAGMRKALKEKQTYFPNRVRIEPKLPLTKTKNFINPVQGKIYLLTDGRCASSCLTFIEQLSQFPNIIQIGQATNADSYYTESRLVHLPSGAHLYFPIKVQRYRQRGRNQPYVPKGKYYYQGDINNTTRIRKWIKKSFL